MLRVRDFKNSKSAMAGKDLLGNESDTLQKGTNYNFLTGIVREVISNPYEYLNRPFKIGENVYNDVTFKDVLSGKVKVLPDGVQVSSPLKNFYHADNMPINSAIIQIVDDSRTKLGEKMVVCYPFFPPHISLPLKTGEYVWMIKEDIKGAENYYWICRKVGIIQVDDLNFTNIERTESIVNIYEKSEKSNKTLTPDPEDFEKMISLGKSTNSNIKESLYSDILKSSVSYVNEFVGEAIPRLVKNSQDMLLQGSNNSGIHLTTEKFNSSSDLSQDSPAIDLYVKRKKDTETFSSNIAGSYNTNSNLNIGDGSGVFVAENFPDGDTSLSHEEIDKVRSVLPGNDQAVMYDAEIKDDQSDAVNAGARLYMSNNSEFDQNFDISFDNLSEQTGPCIISYSQNNRIIGTNSTRIINTEGESYIDMDESGNVVIKASKNSGQEFLSLNNEEKYARINVRGGLNPGKIYLTHQSGNANDLPTKSDDEPYVLVSQLEPILENIYAILNAHNTTFFTLIPARFPPFIAAAAQTVTQALIETKIDTPTLKYQEPINIPVAASAIQGGIAVGTSILRSSHIIADSEKIVG